MNKNSRRYFLGSIFWRTSFLFFLFTTPLWALPKAYVPALGSVERKAIMDTLRAPVENQIKKKVIFKVDYLKVQEGWAFLMVAPLQANGKPMDYHGTPYQKAFDDGMFSNTVCALLHQQADTWKVIEFVLGATDVPFVDWDKKYKAPASIFP